MHRRAFALVLSTSLAGCSGLFVDVREEDPTAPEVIEGAATTALRDDRSWAQLHESDVTFPRVEANGTADGYRVRVEYVVRYVDGQSAATVEAHANLTALLVLHRLYGLDVPIADAFVMGYLRADPTPEFEDVSQPRNKRPPLIHVVEMSGETAAGIDWETITPDALPEAADHYSFDPVVFTPPETGPTA